MIDGFMMPRMFRYLHYLALNNFPSPHPSATAPTAASHLLNNCPQSAAVYLRMVGRQCAVILEVLTPVKLSINAAMDGKQANSLLAIGLQS